MRRTLRNILTLMFVAGLVVPLVVSPAQASRFGPSGPPRYPSFPFDQRFPESGEPPKFVSCAEAGAATLAPCVGTDNAVKPFKWVWKVPPAQYGVSDSSYIVFYSFRNAITESKETMPAPGGVGVNDFEIDYSGHLAKAQQLLTDGNTGNDADGLRLKELAERQEAQKLAKGYYFDFTRPSFTQDVDVVPPDFKSPDDKPVDLNLNPIDFDGDGATNDGYRINHDGEPTSYSPDFANAPSIFFQKFENASIDGTANLAGLAFTVATGTQFMNMQIDRNGNYYVARRDMQWDWIDSYEYKNLETGQRATHDTFFNIQPYPISDAYGWCGAVPPGDPNSQRSMAGQLIKDIAFDVYAMDGSPADGIPAFTTEIVPSFVMRSFGIYVVDVTMMNFGGIRQRYSSRSKGVHQRPVDSPYGPAGSIVQPGDGDYQLWRNRVSPFAAGVVPTGAWVINEGNPFYMQVVPPGTPGAVWHQNKFGGAAFIVRGDMERRINYINLPSGWAGDQNTVADDTQLYAEAIAANAMDRADWTDWVEDVGNNNSATEILQDAH